MICLIQFLYWEGTHKHMKCKGKKCEYYGSSTCWAVRRADDEPNCGADMRGADDNG